MPSFCNLYFIQYSFLYIHTLPNDCSHIEDVHLLFVHISFFSDFLQVFNLDIFSIINAKGVPSLCNLKLQQYSILYIQTLNNDCSHIEDVHLLFCACFIKKF